MKNLVNMLITSSIVNNCYEDEDKNLQLSYLILQTWVS